MILRAALWVLLFLPPCASWAQDVPIRSGEHTDFSRLVLEFDSRVTWQFGRVEGGYELRVDTPEVRFDPSRIFVLIPRTRVLEVEDRGGGRLFIASNCDCHGDAFDLRSSEVVLDIKDGPAPPRAESPFNQPLPSFASVEQPDLVEDPDLETGIAILDTLSPDPPILPRPEPPREARAGLPITFGFGNPPLPTPASPVDPETDAPPLAPPIAEASEQEAVLAEPSATGGIEEAVSDRVSETEEVLLRQIGRAAAQGLLEADLEATEAAVETALDPVPEPEPPHPTPSLAAPAPPSDQPHDPTEHLHIQTVIDRDLGLAQVGVVPRTQEGTTCLPDEYFETAHWGGVPPTDGADLSLHRTRLLGEFDKANSDHVLGLARNYIYLTFGAEAIAVARRYEADLQRPDLLIMMGEIMDHGESGFPAAIVDQMACAGPVALWATLAQHRLEPAADIDREAVIKSFSQLPLHLRRHLGPGLSQKFLDIGDMSTANALRDAIARAPGNHGARFDLLEARLDRSNGGDAAQADDRLDEIINADGPIAPEALMSLIKARVEAEQPISERLRELATSMAYEHRGTETGETLLGLAFEAEARSARFSAALVLLEEAKLTYGADAADTRALHETFMAELVERGDDATFLTHVVPDIDQVQSMSAPVRRAVAGGRLLDLGFAGPARTGLSHPDDIPTPEDRLLFARVALLEGKPGVAMGYLAGLDDLQAVRLRARAQLDLGDHDGAALSWAQIEEDRAQWDAAWLAGGDWEALEQAKDTPYQDVARIVLQDRPDDAEGPLPGNAMSRGQDALSKSRETRSALTNLLEKTGSPP